MLGLKRRVTTGFMGIVTLLFLSGMVSFFELNTLSRYTDDILKTNERNMELAGELLNIAQLQSDAFVDILAFNERTKDSICLVSHRLITTSLAKVRSESLDKAVVDSMTLLANKLQDISLGYISQPNITDSLTCVVAIDRVAVYNEYQTIYKAFISSVYDYMTSAQRSIAPRADQLHRNAYRAVTPVFIALVVMIAIVLMLYYFMMLTCVNPIIQLNKALKESILYKIPFATKHDYRDEVQELKDRIESLTNKSKTSL